MSPRSTCECGSCRKCKARIYQQRYRERHPERARESVRKARENHPETAARAARRWNNENKERRREIARKSSAKLRRQRWDLINEAKDVSCADCGVHYPPCVMDFDHVRGDKVAAVSRIASNGNLQALLDEIEKCEVVCANCHRLRHNC